MKIPLFVDKLTGEVLKLLDPYESLSRKIQVYHNEIRGEELSLEVEEKVHLFALGKAASFQLKSFLDLLEDSVLKDKVGMCVSYTKRDHTVGDKRMIELAGNHPLMTESNLEKTDIFISYLEEVPENESIIFLLSGGASALLERPKNNLSFSELREAHKELLRSGLGINEMNKRRKELSQVKGGGLKAFIKSKNIMQIITCDIPNEKLDDVGSGPLLSGEGDDPPTILLQSANILLDELKKNHPDFIFGKVYDCSIDVMEDDLEKEIQKIDLEKFIHLSGGEAPVTVLTSGGVGGRNTHFVLSMAQRLYQDERNRDLHIMSLGTDGSDGNAPCAGAYINYDLWKSKESDDYLKTFNSYSYFSELDTLIVTGPTRTNVMDLRAIWRE